MLIQSIHYTVADEDGDRAAELFTELQELSRREPGIIAFDIGRSKERPAVFALWEVYRDEAALAAHVASEHFARLVIGGVRRLVVERNAETVFPLEGRS